MRWENGRFTEPGQCRGVLEMCLKLEPAVRYGAGCAAKGVLWRRRPIGSGERDGGPGVKRKLLSPLLPPEIPDHIVGLLHDKLETFKECYLISKPWVPSTRKLKLLFAYIEFNSGGNLKSWKKTFPGSSNSLGHHTHTLVICCT